MTIPAVDLSHDVLIILPWPEASPDEPGFDPRSGYVESCWLGILGPSTTFLMRHLADAFDQWPQGFELRVADAAGSLGLGGSGPKHVFQKSLERAVQFGLAAPHPYGLQVRRRLPPVSPRLLQRLPEPARRVHDEWRQREADAAVARRARSIAGPLLGAGDPPPLVEVALQRLGIPPRAAATAVRAVPVGPAAA